MRKLATSKTAQPGQSYERNGFEVHYFDDEKKRWFCYSRNAATLEEAREQLALRVTEQKLLNEFIKMGPAPKTRIAEIKALCTIIE